MRKQVELKLKNIDDEKINIMHHIICMLKGNTYQYSMYEIITLKEFLLNIKKAECFALLDLLTNRQIEFIMWALELLEEVFEDECLIITL